MIVEGSSRCVRRKTISEPQTVDSYFVDKYKI